MPTLSPDNRLNELSAQEWLQFTKSWFVHNPPPRKSKELLHPAKFPEDMIENFIRFFTKRGQVVCDPFLGTGSTLVAAHATGRNGIGIELQEKYAEIAKERLRKLEGQLRLSEDGAQQHCKQLVIRGNAFDIDTFWNTYKLPNIDCVITSPPYGPMLNKRGLAAEKREKNNLDTHYSDDKDDLGNAESYDDFLTRLVALFLKIKPKVKTGGYLVVILQNYMDKGDYKMLAWDFARKMAAHFQLRGEKIWCQDNKTLYPYGYKYSFVPNVHHHYCLIFRKND
jgi:DNA modification methylase